MAALLWYVFFLSFYYSVYSLVLNQKHIYWQNMAKWRHCYGFTKLECILWSGVSRNHLQSKTFVSMNAFLCLFSVCMHDHVLHQSGFTAKQLLQWLHWYGFFPVCSLFLYQITVWQSCAKKLSIIAVLNWYVFCAYSFMFYQKTFATLAASIWLLPRVYSLLNWNLEESLYYFQLLPTVLSLVSCHITFMSIKMFTITMVALMQLSIDVIMDVPFKMDITLLQGCFFSLMWVWKLNLS